MLMHVVDLWEKERKEDGGREGEGVQRGCNTKEGQ